MGPCFEWVHHAYVLEAPGWWPCLVHCCVAVGLQDAAATVIKETSDLTDSLRTSVGSLWLAALREGGCRCGRVDVAVGGWMWL
jgi:hypothetical protein